MATPSGCGHPTRRRKHADNTMTDGLQLNLWQKHQATLIDYFSSLEYLKGLLTRIEALIAGADLTLDAALADGRDRFIANAQWGTRDTAANWNTYGYPALLDWKQTIQRQISLRAVEGYSTTDAQNCAGKLRELSMRWSSEEEEQKFNRSFDAAYGYASNIDRLMKRPQSANDGVYHTLWNGFDLDDPLWRRPAYGELFPRLPRFRIRTDVVAESGKLPPRTGIYVPQEDPYGTLQFGWTGGKWNGSLAECITFNQLGRQIANAIGRHQLWDATPDLLEYVRQHFPRQFESTVRESCGSTFTDGDLHDLEMGVIFLGRNGFTEIPCKWCFVEKIEDDWEDAAEAEAAATPPSFRQQRVPAGEICPQDGYWNTPAKADSRQYFRQGETFPRIEDSAYGDTFWLWSPHQTS